MLKIIMLTLLASVSTAAFAGENRTIVGYWLSVYSDGECPARAISIQPMGIRFGENYWCEFTSVARSGATVAWNGRCNQGDDKIKPARVVATERGHELAISINGVAVGPYARCDN